MNKEMLSCLCRKNKISEVYSADPVAEDGINHINVYKFGKTELGKYLSPVRKRQLITPFGSFVSIRRYMGFLDRRNYPDDLKNKQTLTNYEFNSIKKLDMLDVPNKWALVAHVYCLRLLHDPSLMNMMKNNVLMYTSYDITNTDNNGLDYVIKYNTWMKRYISIIRHLSSMLVNDKFNLDNVNTFIINCKDDKEKSLTYGMDEKYSNIPDSELLFKESDFENILIN